MSAWMLVFFTLLLKNPNTLGANAQSRSISDQVSDIVKDVSGYFSWLFGYGPEASAESHIDKAESLTEDLVKDLKQAMEWMHGIENLKGSVHDDVSSMSSSEEEDSSSSEDRSKLSKEKDKKNSEENSKSSNEKDDMEVIPIKY